MAIKLEGKPVANKLKKELIKRIQFLKKNNKYPTLQIIRIGESKDDISYEKSLSKNCEKLGIECVIKGLPLEVTQQELETTIKEANLNNKVHGILLFRPLPETLDIEPIKELIDPRKDVDSMCPINIANAFRSDDQAISPCTAKAVMALLDFYGIDLKGANVTIVGASSVVGSPLAMLLINKFATVSVCHIYTNDISTYTKSADIVISATGVPKLLGEKHFTEHSIVIDVGINFDEKGNLCGDVDYEKVFNKVKAITPTAGGIGAITTTILLSHVVRACESL